ARFISTTKLGQGPFARSSNMGVSEADIVFTSKIEIHPIGIRGREAGGWVRAGPEPTPQNLLTDPEPNLNGYFASAQPCSLQARHREQVPEDNVGNAQGQQGVEH